MNWVIKFHTMFEPEFDNLNQAVQDELLSHALLLETIGPTLARPYADTLKGSKYKNMKELRFNAENGVWRVAFAFDPKRQGILLAAGNKAGKNENRFYKELIKQADNRFFCYLSE